MLLTQDKWQFRNHSEIPLVSAVSSLHRQRVRKNNMICHLSELLLYSLSWWPWFPKRQFQVRSWNCRHDMLYSLGTEIYFIIFSRQVLLFFQLLSKYNWLEIPEISKQTRISSNFSLGIISPFLSFCFCPAEKLGNNSCWFILIFPWDGQQKAPTLQKLSKRVTLI